MTDESETSGISDEEYQAMIEELEAKQRRRNRLASEIEDLKDDIAAIENAKRGLATEPGMYFHPEEGWPAVLTEDGRWHDGWGNDFENDNDLEGLKRVDWIEDV